MKNWVVNYKTINSNEIKLARLNATNRSEAVNRATKIINFLNEKNKLYNLEFELLNVIPFEALENWDD